MSPTPPYRADGPATRWKFYGQPTSIVGRVKELHFLRETLRNVVESGSPRSVLVMGPPGIGKTRLVSEFIETIDEHVDKVTVLNVGCRPDGGPAYSVFRRMLKQRFYVSDDDPREAVLEKVLVGIRQVLRDDEIGCEAAHFIGHLVGLRYPRSKHILNVDADPRRIEARAVELLARFFRADARRTPLVVGIDSLHMASDESISLLLKLYNSLTDAPIMVVGAARDHFIERHRAFHDVVARTGDVVTVPALADRDCRRIVESLLSRASELPESFVRLACEKAFGNPLSLEQIIHLQIERGAIDPTTTPWSVDADRLDDTRIPGTLRDLVRSKLARLEPLEQRILAKAAAVGDSFWCGCVDVIRRVDEWSSWDESDRFWNSPHRTNELASVLEGLRRKGILLRQPQSPFPGSRAYAFKHTLEREVLYEAIDGPRQARYHRIIAEWLEAREAHRTHRSDRTDSMIEQIALHWERGQQPRKAASYYIDAGDGARERYLNAKSADFYRKALECLPDEDASNRLEVFHKLGKVQMVMGCHSEALGCFQEMLRLAWLRDDVRKGGVAYNKMGQSYRALGEYPLALDHFKDGLALFRRAEDVRGVAMSVDDIGRVHSLRSELDRALDLYNEGLRLRRYLKDDRCVAVSLHHIGGVHGERGEFKRAVGALREALDLSRKVGDRKQVADILNNLGVICHHRGEREKALKLWEEALEISRVLGERQLEGMLLNNMGETSLSLGRNDEARDLTTQAVAILEAIGDRRGLSDALRNLGDAYLQIDEFAKAREYTERALSVARELGARSYAGLAERNLGEVHSRTLFDDEQERSVRIATATQHFQASIEELEAVGFEAELGRSLHAYGAFLAEIGEEAQARVILERARDIFLRLDMKAALERTERLLSAF